MQTIWRRQKHNMLSLLHAACLKLLFFFLIFVQPASHTVKDMCIFTHTHISECVEIVAHMNYRCHRIIARVKYFYSDRERYEVLTGYLSLRRRSGGDWAKKVTFYIT